MARVENTIELCEVEFLHASESSGKAFFVGFEENDFQFSIWFKSQVHADAYAKAINDCTAKLVADAKAAEQTGW